MIGCTFFAWNLRRSITFNGTGSRICHHLHNTTPRRRSFERGFFMSGKSLEFVKKSHDLDSKPSLNAKKPSTRPPARRGPLVRSKKSKKTQKPKNEFPSEDGERFEFLHNFEKMNDEEFDKELEKMGVFGGDAMGIIHPLLESAPHATHNQHRDERTKKKKICSEQVFDRYKNEGLVVAVVGRPNVGKSTLYNRLVRKNEALITDVSGTTRDRRYGVVEYGQHSFLMIDTGGVRFQSNGSEELSKHIHEQATIAIEEAKMVIFLTDYESEVSREEKELARLLRKLKKPVLIAINKCDNASRTKNEEKMKEYEKLGFGRPIAISAHHGLGSRDLLDQISKRLLECVDSIEGTDFFFPPVDDMKEIRMAIVGVPNVGKSSLLNRILNQERSIVHHIAGTTTDPINERILWDGKRSIVIVDTAGIRKRKSRTTRIEQISALWSLRVILGSHIVVLVIDGTIGANSQDVRLSSQILENYKSCIVVVNKWDLSPDPTIFEMQQYEEQLRQRLSFWDYIPILFVSAKTGFNVELLMEWVVRVSDERGTKLTPQMLFEIIRQASFIRPLPTRGKRTLKFKFAIQVNPYGCPTFVFFVNHTTLLTRSYSKFLESIIRKNHPFTATPIHLIFRKNMGKKIKHLKSQSALP